MCGNETSRLVVADVIGALFGKYIPWYEWFI